MTGYAVAAIYLNIWEDSWVVFYGQLRMCYKCFIKCKDNVTIAVKIQSRVSDM